MKCFTDVHSPSRIYYFNIGELLTFPLTQQQVNIIQISDIPISLSCTFCLMVNMANIVIEINMLALSDVSIAHNTDVVAYPSSPSCWDGCRLFFYIHMFKHKIQATVFSSVRPIELMNMFISR